jgi:hypothetical protein
MADPNDPLELARKELARLKDADDWDEPTGQTNVNVTLKMPSQPEIQAPPKKDSDPPVSVGAIAKNVGFLAKLLPKEQRLTFFVWLIVFGSILTCLAKGWIRFGPH